MSESVSGALNSLANIINPPPKEAYMIPMKVRKGHALTLPTIGESVRELIPGAYLCLHGINVGADGGLGLSLTLVAPGPVDAETINNVVSAFKAGVSPAGDTATERNDH